MISEKDYNDIYLKGYEDGKNDKNNLKINYEIKPSFTTRKLKELQQENKQLKEKIDILLEDNSQLEEIRIKAIEYIQKRFEINEYGEYYFTHTFSNSNMKELLEILGDKENVKN